MRPTQRSCSCRKLSRNDLPVNAAFFYIDINSFLCTIHFVLSSLYFDPLRKEFVIMNVYEWFALVVDTVHLLALFYWIVGFAVSYKRHRTFRTIHSIFGLSICFIQIAFFHGACPLTKLAGYLREIGGSNMPKIVLYQPFIVKMIRAVTGVAVPQTTISLIALAGTIWMTVTLVRILMRSMKEHRNRRRAQ